MAAVTLADDWIHFVLSLATSLTPKGGVMILIMMLHHIIYRLQHQREASLLIWIKLLVFGARNL